VALIVSSNGRGEVDIGFQPENWLTMKMVLPMPKYVKPEARRAFYAAMLQRVEAIPGVEAAGMITVLPLSFSGMNFSFSVEGRPAPSDVELPFALYRVVSPGYFRAMGITLQRGRYLDGHDAPDTQPVILINQRLAEQYWPNEDPIGKRLKIGPLDSPNQWLTVVGIVNNVRQTGIAEEKHEIYVPYAQERRVFMAPRDLVVSTKADSAAVVGAVRQAVWCVV